MLEGEGQGIDNDTISGLRVVRNPDKLAYIDRQLREHGLEKNCPFSS